MTIVQPFSSPLQAVTLEGYGLILQPLQSEHAPDLAIAAADGELWTLHYTSVPAPQQEEAYIAQALEQQALGHQLAFVVRDANTQKIIGTTRYHDIQPEVARLEIGYTWYAKSSQRSHVNTAAKLLLLSHAFEALKANVVGWRTDSENLRSQAAIERLGATKTGTIWGNRLRRNGTVGDSVYYSMRRTEWPEHKARLLTRLTAE